MIPSTRIPIGHLLVYGWMPSPLRRWVYRTFRGYRIGKGVTFKPGSAVIGRDVEIGDYVEIGLLAVVTGRTIRMARHSSVGTMSYVSCERIEIGEDARIREQVYVGGPQFPDSRFSLGARTIVLQQAFINSSKPVVIGDDSGIGGHCLLFTHGAWLNQMDGYPVTYAPVTIGKSVWLPWRVFVMPGSTIGDGAVIGANSLVSGAIPANSLAVGTPAKVIRQAPDFPKAPSEADRARMVTEMMAEFDGYVRYHEYTIAPFPEGGGTYTGPQGTYALRWWKGGAAPEVRAGETLLSEVALTPDQQKAFIARGAYWLDLAGRTRSAKGGPLTEELAAFLGRYGIRLARWG